MPATIELVLISALIALVSGTLLGVYTGINRKGFLKRYNISHFIVRCIAPHICNWYIIYIFFAVILGVLPSFGRGEVVSLGYWTTGFLTLSGLKAIILPSVTLSLFQ